MAKVKRWHYLCDRNYAVATKKRIQSGPMRIHIFDIREPAFLLATPSVLTAKYSVSHYLNYTKIVGQPSPYWRSRRGVSIAVPIATAKLLAGFDPMYLFILHTDNLLIKDEQTFIASVLEPLSPEPTNVWVPPAGLNRGRLHYPPSQPDRPIISLAAHQLSGSHFM